MRVLSGYYEGTRVASLLRLVECAGKFRSWGFERAKAVGFRNPAPPEQGLGAGTRSRVRTV